MNPPGQALTAYLVDVDTGERMEFQYNPNEIVDEKSTAYAAIKVPGMSLPRYQFIAGGHSSESDHPVRRIRITCSEGIGSHVPMNPIASAMGFA